MDLQNIRIGSIIGVRGDAGKYSVTAIDYNNGSPIVKIWGGARDNEFHQIEKLKRMKIQPKYLKELGFDVYRGKYAYKTIELIKIGNIYNLRNMGDSITGIDYMDEVQDFVKLLTGDSL